MACALKPCPEPPSPPSSPMPSPPPSPPCRYRLREHCAHIKSYLLLGKGDFVQYLMEHLAPQLSRPSSQLHRHQLLSLVESAVRSCSEGVGDDSHDLLLRHLDVALPKDPNASGRAA